MSYRRFAPALCTDFFTAAKVWDKVTDHAWTESLLLKMGAVLWRLRLGKGWIYRGNCSSHGCLLLSLLELSCFHHSRCRRLSEFLIVWRLRFFDIFWANDLSRSSGLMTSSAFLNPFDIKFGKESWLRVFICQLKKPRAQKSQQVGLF